MERQIPASLHLDDILKYSALIDQVISTVKSIQGSGIGTSHQMPTVKTWIGDAYWEADLGTWKRLK